MLEADAMVSEAEVGGEPEPVEAIEWDADRYTTTIDEPDWFEAEADDVELVVEVFAARGDRGTGAGFTVRGGDRPVVAG